MKIKKFNEHSKATMVISAFPGCGKSHLFRNKGEKKILETEVSNLSNQVNNLSCVFLLSI
jgi:hypothetical protein